jgi:hypothetical protein
MVSGFTIINTAAYWDQTRRRKTQSTRSQGPNLDRAFLRFRTLT